MTGMGATETAPFTLCTGPAGAWAGFLGFPVPGPGAEAGAGRREARGARARPERHAGLLARRRAHGARPSTRRASIGWATRCASSTRPIPRRGFVFDGRLAEDFKLSTGTWVSVGPLRARILAHCGRLRAGRRDRRPRPRVRVGARVPEPAAVPRPLPGSRPATLRRGRFSTIRASSRSSATSCRRSPARAPAARPSWRGPCCSTSRPRSTPARSPTRVRSTRRRCSRTAPARSQELYADRPAAHVIRLEQARRTRPPQDHGTARCRPARGHRRPRSSAHRRTIAAGRRGGPQVLRRPRPTRDWDALAEYYRSRRMACVVFTVDERLTGRPQVANDAVLDFAAENADIALAFASLDPTPRARRRSRGAAAHRARRRSRAEAAPAAPAVRPERSPGLSALRGVRGGAAARALPHRPQRDRHGHARRRRRAAQVRQPDADRRRGRGLSRHADRPGPPVVPVAGRGDLDLPAQAAGLHRPLGLVAEILPAVARAVREHAAEEQVLFGSDYPFLTPDRWLADFEKLAIRDEVRPLILKENAARLLGLAAGSAWTDRALRANSGLSTPDRARLLSRAVVSSAVAFSTLGRAASVGGGPGDGASWAKRCAAVQQARGLPMPRHHHVRRAQPARGRTAGAECLHPGHPCAAGAL